MNQEDLESIFEDLFGVGGGGKKRGRRGGGFDSE